MTTDEAAARLGVLRDTVSGYCRTGKLAGRKAGRDYDITEAALAAFAATHPTKRGFPRGGRRTHARGPLAPEETP